MNDNIITVLKKFNLLLDFNHRKNLILLFLLKVYSGFMDMIGVASIAPVILVLTKREILDENNETGIGMDLDLKIYVDGELVAFDPEKYNEILEEPVFIEDDNENQSYLIEETVSRGCIYECNFDGVFDQENLNFYFYEYELGGSGQSIKVLEVDYDDIDCEDRNASVEGYYVKVLKPDGSIHESNVGSATDEVQNEQNSNEHSTRIYSFDDKETFQKFREYIEENIQENIDMGINKSVIAYSDPNSGLYQITFTGPLDDLEFLPNPDLGWVEEEIGIIRDSWNPNS